MNFPAFCLQHFLSTFFILRICTFTDDDDEKYEALQEELELAQSEQLETKAFYEKEIADLEQKLKDKQQENEEAMARLKRRYDDLVHRKRKIELELNQKCDDLLQGKLQSEQQWNAKFQSLASEQTQRLQDELQQVLEEVK